MYPPHINVASEMNAGQMGELRVYQILKDCLPDDWVVIHDCWRYYLNSKRYTNYEMDFIILVPQKGFVVIEVKNWHEAKVVDGKWMFLARGGKWESMEEHKLSPLHQAFLAAKKLDNEFRHVKRFSKWYTKQNDDRITSRIAFHALAVLPNQSAEIIPHISVVEQDAKDALENAVPLDQLYICGEDNLRNNLQGKIEDLFSRNAPPYYHPLTPGNIQDIVGYLMPSFHLKGDPAAYNRIMEDAATSLHSVLPLLEPCEMGIHVMGCAGSGKTWMATHEIARLYGKYGTSKRFLFLCYNRALAEHVRRLPELAAGIESRSIEVYTFSDLCKRIINRSFESVETLEMWFKSLQSGALDGSVREVYQMLRSQTTYNYDFIFIDECQDFHENWGFIITALQNSDSKCYYFSDSNQNIFMEGANPYSPGVPTRLMLHRNLRNSAEIARYSSAILDGLAQIEPMHVPGCKIEISNATEDVNERARLVKFWIDRLIYKKRNEKASDVPEGQQNHWCAARPHQIVVISPYSPTVKKRHPECTLPYVSQVTCQREGLHVGELLAQREKEENLIVGTSIRSIKGLESDYVILTDIDEPGSDHAQSKNDFFVACTRAKFGLIIIPKSVKGEEYARSLLKN